MLRHDTFAQLLCCLQQATEQLQIKFNINNDIRRERLTTGLHTQGRRIWMGQWYICGTPALLSWLSAPTSHNKRRLFSTRYASSSAHNWTGPSHSATIRHPRGRPSPRSTPSRRDTSSPCLFVAAARPKPFTPGRACSPPRYPILGFALGQAEPPYTGADTFYFSNPGSPHNLWK